MWRKLFAKLVHDDYHFHHIRLSICFPCLHGSDGFLWDFQAFVFSYVLADLPFIQVTSHCLIPCIPRSPSGETTGNLVGSTFTTPSTHFYSSILSTRPNHRSLLSCKHSLVLFNFGLVLRFSAEILSSALTLHIHLTTLLSFLSSLINIFPFYWPSPTTIYHNIAHTCRI